MCRDNSYYVKRSEHIDRWLLQKWEQEWLQNEYGDRSLEFEPTYHKIAGASKWPIIVLDTVTEERASPIAHWGILPKYVSDQKEAFKLSFKTVNVRAEEVENKKTYKDLLARKRCILPSTGFFEHHHIERGGKDVSIAFHIRKKDDPIFGIAALYDEWLDRETDSRIISFSSFTTAANEPMQRIHNYGEFKHRMPLMLDRDMEAAWIDPKTPMEQIKEMIAYRIPADKLEYWPVQSVRKRDRVDGPELLTRQQVEEIDWA